MDELITVAIALGSNLGNREQHLSYAVERLSPFLSDLRVSPFIETDPVGCPPSETGAPAPAFLNAAVVGRTTMSARSLLDTLQTIERERGRDRPFANAPRTLDLDLVLFGDAIIDEPDLVVPHPRFRERAFVLEPLAAIAPELRDPVTGRRVREVWENLRGAQS